MTDMPHFYNAVIRPVLEYACPVWHTGLTKEQCHKIESIQKRDVCIIYGSSGPDYEQLCLFYKIPLLYQRREDLNKRFFEEHVLHPSGCLHYLLPEKRDTNVTIIDFDMLNYMNAKLRGQSEI